MTISVIIPIYNEEKTIAKLLQTLEPLGKEAEILFVDGGSSDRTLTQIPESYRVISGPKGRARQMNLGAETCHGDILFFLHCDSEIPKDASKQIRKVMELYRAGCFGIAFHSGHIWMKCCQFLSNRRVRTKGIMFGDQGIFLQRELFFAVGGFLEIPIMEDYQLSLTLRERGIKIGMTETKIHTSDRRFVKGGRLRVMWKMNRLRAMYRKGADIREISARYRDIR